jgi:hypothetical protein
MEELYVSLIDTKTMKKITHNNVTFTYDGNILKSFDMIESQELLIKIHDKRDKFNRGN